MAVPLTEAEIWDAEDNASDPQIRRWISTVRLRDQKIRELEATIGTLKDAARIQGAQWDRDRNRLADLKVLLERAGEETRQWKRKAWAIVLATSIPERAKASAILIGLE